MSNPDHAVEAPQRCWCSGRHDAVGCRFRNGKDLRSVPLTPRAAGALQRRKKDAETKKKHSPFVFPGASNSAQITSVQHPHKAAIEAAGLEKFEIYCRRRTFGTRAPQSGMDRFTLARLMGHSSPSVATRYYIHVTETHIAAGFVSSWNTKLAMWQRGSQPPFPNQQSGINRILKLVAHPVAHTLENHPQVIEGFD